MRYINVITITITIVVVTADVGLCVTMTTYHANQPSQREPGCGIVGSIVKRRNVVIFIPRCIALEKLRMSCRVQNTDGLRK